MALVLSSSHQNNDLTMKLVGREEEVEDSQSGRSASSVLECTDENSSNNNASQVPQQSRTPASQAMDVEEFDGDGSSSSSPPTLPFAVEEEDDNDDDVDVGVGDVTSATNNMAVMDDDEAPAVPESDETEEQDESGEEEDSSYVMVENENVNEHEHGDGGEDDTMQQQQEEEEEQKPALSSDDYWDTAASNTAEETAPVPTPDPPLILLPPPPQLPSTNTVIEEEEPEEEDNSNDDNNGVNGADKSMSVDPLFDDGFDFPFASSSSSSPSNAVDQQDQHQEEQVTEFGGLDNMGNTCYMNSALQMLASLDGFTADLRSTSMPVIVKGEESSEEQQQEQERNSEETNGNDDADGDTEMIATSTTAPSPTTNSGQDSSPLRDSLLDVFKRLVNGETIRPGHFKECVDDRTPLFVGYDQQDAHEFLTTLLDMLDEDYKRKQKPEQEDENKSSENDNSDGDDAEKDNVVADGDGDKQTNDDALATETGLVSDSEEDEKSTGDNEILAGTDDDVDSDKNFAETGSSLFESTTTTTTAAETFDDENVVADHAENDDDDVAMETSEPATPLRSDDSTVTVRSEHETPSSTKKQRLHESEFEIVNGTDVAAGGTDQSFPRTSSLSNMEFVDIENLLYSDVSNTSLALVPHTAFVDGTTDNSPAVEATVDEKAPKCKLVGGRMDPTDAVLTRYDSGGDSVPVDPDSTVGASNAPSANSLSEATPGKQTDDADGNHDSETTSTESVRSPIDSNFCTEIKVCLTCDSCKFRRSHTEKYLHLSLEMGDGISSIDDGLRKFFASEEREVKCEKCFYNKSTVTKEIVHLPRALLLHLKRFIVDVSPDYTSISYRKDRSDISFEERMSLARVVGDDEEEEQLNNGNNYGGLVDFLAPEATVEDGSSYAIRSVVNHMGSTATFGHYTADAKRVYPQKEEERNMVGSNDNGNDDDAMLSEDRDIDSSPSSSSNRREWIRFNDSYVSKISSTEALQHNSSAAYLVLYEMEKKSAADCDDIRRSHHCEDETYHETTDSTDAADAVTEVDDSTMHYYADDNNTDVMAVCI